MPRPRGGRLRGAARTASAKSGRARRDGVARASVGCRHRQEACPQAREQALHCRHRLRHTVCNADDRTFASLGSWTYYRPMTRRIGFSLPRLQRSAAANADLTSGSIVATGRWGARPCSHLTGAAALGVKDEQRDEGARGHPPGDASPTVTGLPAWHAMVGETQRQATFRDAQENKSTRAATAWPIPSTMAPAPGPRPIDAAIATRASQAS